MNRDNLAPRRHFGSHRRSTRHCSTRRPRSASPGWNAEETVDVDGSGIESARMRLRRGRRSARATIALAVVCVIATLVASYRSWHQDLDDSSPRLALNQPSQAAQPPKPPPVEPLTAVESYELSLAAKAHWPTPAAEERTLIQALAKAAAIVRPIARAFLTRRLAAMSPSRSFTYWGLSLRAPGRFSAPKRCGPAPIDSRVSTCSSSQAAVPTSRLMPWARKGAGP